MKRMNPSTVYALVSAIMALGMSSEISATAYYVNSTAGNASDAGGGSSTQPWKSVTPLDGRAFNPGDTVYFARGSSYTGGFRVTASGTSSNPITFTANGTGAAPIFTNANYSVLTGNVVQVAGDYIVVDGLCFKGCAGGPAGGADTDILKVGAVYGLTGADYLTVKNCEITDCPIGVYVNGQHCLVTKNNLHDCNRFLSNPDWGPIAIVVGNAYTEISFNRAGNYIVFGGNYGWDGGFIELESRYYGGPIHDLKIHHNISVGCCGFMEEVSGGDSVNVWYNVSDDYGDFLYPAGNARIDNNTVIRTRPVASGADNCVFSMEGISLTARNNIFVVAYGLQVWTDPASKIVHENNLYYCTDNSTADPCGRALGAGEKVANPAFVNLTGGDYHLTSGSPAKDAGANLGYTVDFDGASVPMGSAPDMGAYEFGGVTTAFHYVNNAAPTSTAIDSRGAFLEAYDLAGKRLRGSAMHPRGLTGAIVTGRGTSWALRPSQAR